MASKLRKLGLGVVASIALSAMAAATAAAEAFDFEAEAVPVTIKAVQPASEEDVLTTTVGKMSCSEVTYTGSQSGYEATTVEVEPKYAGCVASGIPSTFQANGCKYRFHAETVEGGKREGAVDVVCPAGKEMLVTASLFGTVKCSIHVPSQNGLKSVTYTQTGSGTTREIRADLSLSGIKYTHTAGSGFGACSGGSAENGTYEGAALATGETLSGEHAGLLLEQQKERLGIAPGEIKIKVNESEMITVTNASVAGTGIIKITGQSLGPAENVEYLGATCFGVELDEEESCSLYVKCIENTEPEDLGKYVVSTLKTSATVKIRCQ